MEVMLKRRGCTLGHATNYFWAHNEPLEGILLSALGKRIGGNGLPGLPRVKEEEKNHPYKSLLMAFEALPC